MPNISSVEDIKPKISLVEDVKAKLSSVEDTKPKMSKVFGETDIYYEPETTLVVGQTMGLLLTLTYAEEHTHIPVRY